MYLSALTDESQDEKQLAALRSQASSLVNNLPTWENGDTFYWFAGTLLMHQIGRTSETTVPWLAWNKALTTTLVKNQTSKGHENGSWDPKGDLCQGAGRVFSTALSAICLETYYRYLPPEE